MEDQIKSESNVFKSDLIMIINNIESQIYSDMFNFSISLWNP
jgi:hypothetical protein